MWGRRDFVAVVATEKFENNDPRLARRGPMRAVQKGRPLAKLW